MKKGRALSEEDVGKASGGQIQKVTEEMYDKDGKLTNSSIRYDYFADDLNGNGMYDYIGSTTDIGDEKASEAAKAMGVNGNITREHIIKHHKF